MPRQRLCNEVMIMIDTFFPFMWMHNLTNLRFIIAHLHRYKTAKSVMSGWC